MESINKFSGKTRGGLKQLTFTEQSNLKVFMDPSSGLVMTSNITYLEDGDVYNIFGTYDTSGFDSPEEITEHGEKFSPKVVMSVAKIDDDKGTNLEDILRRKLFIVLYDNNGNLRVLGGMKDGEDVTCIVSESSGNGPSEKSGYVLTFVWESTHQPYFIAT